MSERRRYTGFTLVELVAVLLILGIIGAISALVVVQPFTADRHMRQRARLIDQADLIVDRIRREVRAAVPNSVRTRNPAGNRQAVEFVPSKTGGRYRRYRQTGGGGEPLKLNEGADSFDILGTLPDFDGIETSSTGGVDCAVDENDCINIFNTGQTNFNIYPETPTDNPDNVAKIVGTNTSPDQIVYDNNGANNPAFQAHSPNQRFLVFNDVVSFVCDTDSEKLLRYSSYGLSANQPVADSDFGGGSAPVADHVTQCAFDYEPGVATRQGLLKIDIRIERGGEAVDLFAQVHVVNGP